MAYGLFRGSLASTSIDQGLATDPPGPGMDSATGSGDSSFDSILLQSSGARPTAHSRAGGGGDGAGDAAADTNHR